MDISLYQSIVALHVVAIAAWFGTALTFAVIGTRVRGRGDDAATVAFLGDTGWVSRAVTLPAAVVALLSGGYLMGDAKLGLGANWWLAAGISLWLVAFLGGTMSRGAECARITRLAAAEEVDAEDVRWRARRVLLLARGELLLLAIALFLMVTQPS